NLHAAIRVATRGQEGNRVAAEHVLPRPHITVRRLKLSVRDIIGGVRCMGNARQCEHRKTCNYSFHAACPTAFNGSFCYNSATPLPIPTTGPPFVGNRF